MRHLFRTFGILTTLLFVSSLIVIPAVAGDRHEYPAQKITFSELPKGWKVGNPTKFNFFKANRKSPEAMLFVRAADIKDGNTKAVDERTAKWLNFVEKKYKWKNMEIKKEGWTEVGGEKAYWLIEEHTAKSGAHINHKLYALQYGGKMYLIRLMSKAENFEIAVGEFENWVQTIQFL